MIFYETETNQRIQEGLKKVDTTKFIEISSGAINKIGVIFKDLFDISSVVIIADNNTYEAAGKLTKKILYNSGIKLQNTYILEDSYLRAQMRYVDELVNLLSITDAIPVAVGSETINDLTKLAAHRCQRGYISVATAGSVDGYAAFGASITYQGFKQTIFCPAPIAIIADLDIIAQAPEEMNSWGYADLIAKIPAGADWIIADALDIETIDQSAWELVQKPLRRLIANPAGIAGKDRQALCFLMEGLIMSGLAMQKAHTSRAGSGAEHQFSHLWDMQHHKYNEKGPSHGFKVAIGSLATLALYEILLNENTEEVLKNTHNALSSWCDFSEIEMEITNIFTQPKEAAQLIEQSREKYIDAQQLRTRISKINQIWPDLRLKLQKQIIHFQEFRNMLQAANAPINLQDIGIGRERLKKSYRVARFMRKRYTILDFLTDTGCLQEYVNSIFESEKYWCNET